MADRVVRGHEGRFTRDPVLVFSAGGHHEQFWHRQGCPLFDVVHPAFPLLTTASPTLQGTLRDEFRDPWGVYITLKDEVCSEQGDSNMPCAGVDTHLIFSIYQMRFI